MHRAAAVQAAVIARQKWFVQKVRHSAAQFIIVVLEDQMVFALVLAYHASVHLERGVANADKVSAEPKMGYL